MNRWEGIHEFVHVVEAGSFSAAAQQLGVSTSQVSKQIARLEERLQARLLNRSTRRVVPTEEGELYYQRCKRILESLQSAEEDIGLNRYEARGNVHIAISAEIGESLFTPLLARFLAEHPQLSIEVSLSDGCGDLIGPGHDLAIWCGRLDDSSLVARRLCELELVAVASPAYLARHSAPQQPDDLARHNCLVSSNGEWVFSDGETRVAIDVSGNWRSPHVTIRLAAACGDMGIALLPRRIAADAIAQQRLVPVLGGWNRQREAVWAVYPQNRYLAARVRLLLDFLAAEFTEFGSALPASTPAI